MTATHTNGQPALGTRGQICDRCGETTRNGTCRRCDAATVLHKFMVLPKRFAGVELLIHFLLDQPTRTTEPAECRVLGLPFGETAAFGWRVCCGPFDSAAGVQTIHCVYASAEIAEQLLDLPQGTIVTAQVQTVFGLEEDENDSDKQIAYAGLHIVAVLETRTPSTTKDP
jgi:hypothetical protein